MNLYQLDEQFRLHPWLYEAHKAFVVGQFAAKSTESKENATKYIQEYEKREAEDDEAYEGHVQFNKTVQESMQIAEDKRSDYPERVKLDWNPLKKKSTKKASTKKTEEKATKKVTRKKKTKKKA